MAKIDFSYPLLICGLPASGKSTFAEELSKKFNLLVLEWDSMIKDFGSKEEMNEEGEFARKLFNSRIKAYKPNLIVDVFQQRCDRLEVLKLLNYNANILIIQCSLQTCLSRNSIRKKSFVSNAELEQIFYSFEPVSISEGFNKIYVFNTDRRKVVNDNGI